MIKGRFSVYLRVTQIANNTMQKRVLYGEDGGAQPDLEDLTAVTSDSVFSFVIFLFAVVEKFWMWWLTTLKCD